VWLWVAIGAGVIVFIHVAVFVAMYLYLFVSIMPRFWSQSSAPLPTIHLAAAAGDRAAIQAELDAGVSIDLATVDAPSWSDGTTPLHVATWRGDADLTRWLIEEGANIEAVCRGGDQPIHIAHSSVIPLLLEAGADLEALTDFHQTPLMRHALTNRRRGDIESIRVLLDAGANPDATDKEGRTAVELLEGFPYADPEVLRLLKDAEQAGQEDAPPK